MIELLKEDELKLCEKINIKKNIIIAYEDDICDSIYYIIDGEIKISSSSIEGNEDIYNILKTGEMFANVLIFSEKNRYLGDVIATKDSTILKIKKEVLLNIFNSNPRFLEIFLKYNSNETMKSKLQLKLLSKRSIKDRILYYLSMNNGKVEISINELSRNIMINRVCVSRVISELIKENKVKKIGKCLIIV